MNKKLLTIFLFILSFSGCFKASSQSPDTCFTTIEINQLYDSFRHLEISDSLKSVKIDLLQQETKSLNTIISYDSSLFKFKERQIELMKQEVDIYKNYSQQVKPKWYENRHLWFLLGAGTTILIGYTYVHTQ